MFSEYKQCLPHCILLLCLRFGLVYLVKVYTIRFYFQTICFLFISIWIICMILLFRFNWTVLCGHSLGWGYILLTTLVTYFSLSFLVRKELVMVIILLYGKYKSSWARGGWFPPPPVINFHDSHGQVQPICNWIQIVNRKNSGTIKDGVDFSFLVFVLGKYGRYK